VHSKIQHGGEDIQKIDGLAKNMLLVKEVYKMTGTLPKSETYIVTSQILRAVISVPSNIAESFKRNGHAEFR
jgi:four helix bundle protein